jgi:hypothetical protein
LARLDESIAAFNQRFIFPLPFAMKIIKINLWNQGMHGQILKGNAGRNCPEIVLPPFGKVK